MRRALGLFIVLVSFAGFLISFYLTVAHYRQLVPPCFAVSGCESVTISKYSTVLGIPVSLVGTLFFAVMFYLAIGLLTSPHRGVVRAFVVLAYAGVLAALYFFLLQAVILDAYCSWCLTTEGLALCLLAGGFVLTWSRRRPESPPE